MDPYKVAVVGGAGKMGGGIALTLLSSLQSDVTVMDLSKEGLDRLHGDLIRGLRRHGEKIINSLRAHYASNKNLVSNEEIIDAFIEEKMRRLHLTTSLSHIEGASWVFEAVIEDVDVKSKLFKMIGTKDVLYFTNSSSIPIRLLADLSNIPGQLIGLHFYNPVPQKKLIELVIPPECAEKRKQVQSLCNALGKTFVEPNDIAGFIGNGFFIREVLFAEELVRELKDKMGEKKARSLIDFVTEKLLVRPMGIYRLVQFVGVETVCLISQIMATYLNEPLKISHFDGSIEPYSKQGELIDSIPAWRERPSKEELNRYFSKLFQRGDEASDLARRFLFNSRLIAEGLVKSGVAKDKRDVETVLTLGFDHLYSPFTVHDGGLDA